MRLRSIVLATILMVAAASAALNHQVPVPGASAQSGYPPPEPPSAVTPGPHTNSLYVPLLGKNAPPIPFASASYYVGNGAALSSLPALGSSLGTADNTPEAAGRDRLVILHFGYPSNSGSNYGVKLSFEPGVFVSMSSVSNAVVSFAQNWYTNSSSNTTAHLRIVLGVVNCCQSGDPNGDLSLMRGHGTAWATTIQTIRSQIVGYISAHVDLVAGYDMEYEWNRPYASSMGEQLCRTGPGWMQYRIGRI